MNNNSMFNQIAQEMIGKEEEKFHPITVTHEGKAQPAGARFFNDKWIIQVVERSTSPATPHLLKFLQVTAEGVAPFELMAEETALSDQDADHWLSRYGTVNDL